MNRESHIKQGLSFAFDLAERYHDGVCPRDPNEKRGRKWKEEGETEGEPERERERVQGGPCFQWCTQVKRKRAVCPQKADELPQFMRN